MKARETICRAIEPVERWVVRIETALVFLLILGMSAFVAAGIAFRILNLSVPWTNEISQIFLVWMMFVGANLGTYYREHVGVTILPDRLRGAPRILLLYIAQSAIVGFSSYIAIVGIKHVRMQMMMGGTTFSLPIDIPTYLIAAILPISFLAGTLHSLRQLIEMTPETRSIGSSELQKVETMVGTT